MTVKALTACTCKGRPDQISGKQRSREINATITPTSLLDQINVSLRWFFFPRFIEAIPPLMSEEIPLQALFIAPPRSTCMSTPQNPHVLVYGRFFFQPLYIKSMMSSSQWSNCSFITITVFLRHGRPMLILSHDFLAGLTI